MLERVPKTTKSAKQMQAAKVSGLTKGLSAKLLLLTMVFVMIAEVLIFVPSVANFRNVWLQNHLDTAESASIVYLDGREIMLSPQAQTDLLKATEALSVSIRKEGISQLMASVQNSAVVSERIELGGMQPIASLKSTLSTLFFGGDKTYHLFAKMKSGDGEIHLVQEDRFLRSALLVFARNILLISLVISLITATLVYLALYWLIVRPIIKISTNMNAFSQTPENQNLIYKPTGRVDEIGIAEQRLAALQVDLQSTLRQKQHLADLGLAVSKINHDLRNILSSAHLFSDRLLQLPDPTVQKFAPKLIRTIDRAVEYTRAVLAYGRATESKPELQLNSLKKIVDDVEDSLAPELEQNVIGWHNKVPPSLSLMVDSEQVFRAILNICSNAVQAISEENDNDSKVHKLSVLAETKDGFVDIRIKDTGPGIPDHTLDKLFVAFEGSSRAGGTGLGLAISTELIKAHGGKITLEKTSPAGTVFLIQLPKNN